MIRNRRIRKRRGTSWNSESSKLANKVRWDNDRARRDELMPERIREMEEIEALNFPRNQGDALGCLQYTDFRTGKIRRWVVKIGDRSDRVTLHAPCGKHTKSHGWTWIMNHLRGYLAGTKR